MSFDRAKITQLRPNVHLIDDAGESTCYLITGNERALISTTLPTATPGSCAARRSSTG